MGSLKKKIKAIAGGVGKTGASGGGFEGSTQYTGLVLGQKAKAPTSAGSTRPVRTGSKRTGGARTPLSV